MEKIIGFMFILILVFLVLNNAQASTSVIGAISGGVTGLTGVLQGRRLSGGNVS